MENIKKYKNVYISICVMIVVICIIICLFLDKKNKNDESNFTNFLDNESEFSINEIDNELDKNKDEKYIFVHISGEVINPGVYSVLEGARIKDVITVAGGMTEYADISQVNLAFQVSDGQKIEIPNINNKNTLNIVDDSSGNGIIKDDEINSKNRKININTATQTEFESLNGIGPSLAKKIIQYRSQNGKFKDITDLKNVSGIGESKFKEIEANIEV